jgi:hypothetical protein
MNFEEHRLLFLFGIASPVVALIGLIVGIWARISDRSPRIALLLTVLAAILPLTIAGLYLNGMANPQSRYNIGVGAANAIAFLLGPQSVLVAILTITICIAGRKRT